MAIDLNGDCPQTLTMDGRSQGPGWYCLRSQPKREHIAAARLRQMDQVEVFCPRIRFQRSTQRGPVWVTEPLFPNYLFARFDLAVARNRIQAAQGVAGIVHFGSRFPSVPESAIQELRAGLGGTEQGMCARPPEPGMEVAISGGIFHGLRAIVSQVYPARERLRVLLQLLGQVIPLELDCGAVVMDDPWRMDFGKAA